MATLPTVGGSNNTWGTELVDWLQVAHNAGGGLRLPDTIVVAASGSSVVGDYQCDGTADEVQIQDAIDDLRGGDGGLVLLTAGTYNLAAPVDVDGQDDVDVEQDIALWAAGPAATTLAVGSGVAAGLRLRQSVRAHLGNFGLTIDGASHGIQAVHSTTPAALLRSAWFATLSRIQVIGPFDGGDSGWPLLLENVFRASIRDVEINGTTNGMRWYNATSAFNAGDSNITRCFIDLGSGGNNGVAYDINSNLGNMNQLSFDTCHSIANASATGTVAWRFTGAGNTSHVRARNCNVEQFATTVQIGSTASDVDVDLVHVTLRNGAVLVDADGYDSRVRCGLAYVEASATVTVVDDDNGYAAKPNEYEISGYADTGSTANIDLGGTGLMRRGVWDGPGTIAAANRKPPNISPTRVVSLADAATIATDASLGTLFRVTLGGNRTLGAPTNPTDGQVAQWEFRQDGTGSRTITLNAAFVLATGVSSTLTTTANRYDLMTATYNATAAKWWVTSFAKNLS